MSATNESGGADAPPSPAAASKADEEATTTAEWAFAGRRSQRDGKVSFVWVPIEDPEDERWYAKQLVPASVGGVYEVTLSSEGSVYVGGLKRPRYLRRLDDSTMVRDWSVRDLAAGRIRDLKSAATKASKVDPLEEILAPIQALSVRLTASERRALAARLLEVLYV